jgi:hypothetical protein
MVKGKWRDGSAGRSGSVEGGMVKNDLQDVARLMEQEDAQ